MTDTVTGRDSFILAEALALAIVFYDRLPKPPHSNVSDMKDLLEHHSANGEWQMNEARRKFDILFPPAQ
jgi:hypothetical protein